MRSLNNWHRSGHTTLDGAEAPTAGQDGTPHIPAGTCPECAEMGAIAMSKKNHSTSNKQQTNGGENEVDENSSSSDCSNCGK